MMPTAVNRPKSRMAGTGSVKSETNPIAAVSAALKHGSRANVPEALRAGLEDEVGDLFFVLVNIARYLGVDPESALRQTNRKFRRRFGWMEEQLRRQDRNLQDVNLEEMETLWQQAKTLEEDER